MYRDSPIHMFFLLNDPPTTDIYTLSLHDALPICLRRPLGHDRPPEPRRRHPPLADREAARCRYRDARRPRPRDRKSTRLNSSHVKISYAVFCLKKKKNKCDENKRKTFNTSEPCQL